MFGNIYLLFSITFCCNFSGKRRASEGGFIGCEKIQKQLKGKPAVRRIGIKSEGPPARRKCCPQEMRTLAFKIYLQIDECICDVNSILLHVRSSFSIRMCVKST